jgi:hypothetical protein
MQLRGTFSASINTASRRLFKFNTFVVNTFTFLHICGSALYDYTARPLIKRQPNTLPEMHKQHFPGLLQTLIFRGSLKIIDRRPNVGCFSL